MLGLAIPNRLASVIGSSIIFVPLRPWSWSNRLATTGPSAGALLPSARPCHLPPLSREIVSVASDCAHRAIGTLAAACVDTAFARTGFLRAEHQRLLRVVFAAMYRNRQRGPLKSVFVEILWLVGDKVDCARAGQRIEKLFNF